jgi:hypothetical protein
MTPAQIQDLIAKGMGVAARQIGARCDAFRPRGPSAPVSLSCRYMQLPASFNAEDASYERPNGYGRATWFGVFDAAYTQPGDYLAGPPGVFFIAAQPPLLPVLCVRTNRTISAIRPAAPSAPGVNAYGGLTLAGATVLLTGWPASVLSAGNGQGLGVDLPGDTRVPFCTVLLPVTPVVLRSSDVLTDDLGRNFVISSAESTDLGWRLLCKQATT